MAFKATVQIWFLTLLLQHSIQLYIGRSSPLLFPSFYLSLVKKTPSLKMLCDLVKKLPHLDNNPSWSPRWLINLPLSGCLFYNPPALDRISNVTPFSLPLRYTLSDVAIWYSYSRQFVLWTTASTHAEVVIRELFPLLFKPTTPSVLIGISRYPTILLQYLHQL